MGIHTKNVFTTSKGYSEQKKREKRRDETSRRHNKNIYTRGRRSRWQAVYIVQHFLYQKQQNININNI